MESFEILAQKVAQAAGDLLETARNDSANLYQAAVRYDSALRRCARRAIQEVWHEQPPVTLDRAADYLHYRVTERISTGLSSRSVEHLLDAAHAIFAPGEPKDVAYRRERLGWKAELFRFGIEPGDN